MLNCYFVLQLDSIQPPAVSTSAPLASGTALVTTNDTSTSIPLSSTTPFHNGVYTEEPGRLMVQEAQNQTIENAKFLNRIFRGLLKNRPHVRKEDFKAPQTSGEELSHLFTSKGELKAILRDLRPNSNTKSILIHGPKGANARNLVLERANQALETEKKKDGQKSNIVIFCSNDIDCDDSARKLLKLVPAGKIRFDLLKQIRVIRDAETLKTYKDLDPEEPKIIFVNGLGIKSKIKTDDSPEKVSKALSKLNSALNLKDLKYLYFLQAHEIGTDINQKLYKYLTSEIKPDQNGTNDQTLEIIGTTHFKPNRGQEENIAKLEDLFQEIIYLPNPNELIVTGKMPRINAIEVETQIGENVVLEKRSQQKRPRQINLKTDYTEKDAFYENLLNKHPEFFGYNGGRNIIEIVRSEPSLQTLINFLKKKNLAFAVLVGEGQESWFDNNGNEHKDFPTRISCFDRLGKDYPLLIHYNDPLATGLEIAADRKTLLCLPDAGDDQVEACIANLRTRCTQKTDGEEASRSILFLRRSPNSKDSDTRNRQPIADMIDSTIDQRHRSKHKHSGRDIRNGSFGGSSFRKAHVASKSAGMQTNEVDFAIEDLAWLNFINQKVLQVKKPDGSYPDFTSSNNSDYKDFTPKIDKSLEGYAELILEDLSPKSPSEDLSTEKPLERCDYNQKRIYRVLKGESPKDPLKRLILGEFFTNEAITEAAAKFPHLLGIENIAEAQKRIELKIENDQVKTKLNQEWITTLNKYSSNHHLELISEFLSQINNSLDYGPILEHDYLLEKALLVLLGVGGDYNGSQELSQKLFTDFYNFANQTNRYSIPAIRVNRILAETELGKASFQIDFRNSLGNLQRAEDISKNAITLFTEDSKFFTKNPGWIQRLDITLGLQHFPDAPKLVQRIITLSDYISDPSSIRAKKYLNNENSFKDLLSILLGHRPKESQISLESAQVIFEEFIGFIQKIKGVDLKQEKSPGELIRKQSTAVEIRDLASAQNRIRDLTKQRPVIEAASNWQRLLGNPIDLAAEFLFERHLIPAKNGDLKAIVADLICYQNYMPNGFARLAPNQSLFAEFADWLQVKNPTLHPFLISKQSGRNGEYYKIHERIKTETDAKLAIEYAIEDKESPIHVNQAWIQYLDGLVQTTDSKLSHLDLFAEYLISLRKKKEQPEDQEPEDLFTSFKELKSALSIIAGNGKAKTPDELNQHRKRFRSFIEFLKNKFKERYDPITTRGLFPQYIEFQEIISNQKNLSKSVLLILDGLFTSKKSQLEIFENGFNLSKNRLDLADFISTFLFNHQSWPKLEIKDKNKLQSLIEQLLGINKNLDINNQNGNLTCDFITELASKKEISKVDLYPIYPTIIDPIKLLTTNNEYEKRFKILKTLYLINKPNIVKNEQWEDRLGIAFCQGNEEEYAEETPALKSEKLAFAFIDFMLSSNSMDLSDIDTIINRFKILSGDQTTTNSNQEEASKILTDFIAYIQSRHKTKILNNVLALLFPKLFHVNREMILDYFKDNQTLMTGLHRSRQLKIDGKFNYRIALDIMGEERMPIEDVIIKILRHEFGLDLKEACKIMNFSPFNNTPYKAAIQHFVDHNYINRYGVQGSKNLKDFFEALVDSPSINAKFFTYNLESLLLDTNNSPNINMLKCDAEVGTNELEGAISIGVEIFTNKIVFYCIDAKNRHTVKQIININQEANIISLEPKTPINILPAHLQEIAYN